MATQSDTVDLAEQALEMATRLAQRNAEMRAVLVRLLDPEDLGHAVSGEVRRLVSGVLRGGHADRSA